MKLPGFGIGSKLVVVRQTVSELWDQMLLLGPLVAMNLSLAWPNWAIPELVTPFLTAPELLVSAAAGVLLFVF